jgi:hypothetical protein
MASPRFKFQVLGSKLICFAKKEARPTVRDRLRDALISGTAGAYLGSMVLDGKVKLPQVVRKVARTRRRTLTIHGARVGGAAGAGLGLIAKPSKDTADSVAGGGDWRFEDGKKPLTPGQKAALAAGGTLAAGGLVLCSARGRNALRSAMAGGNPLSGLLSKAPGGNPRRVRLMKAQQKRKDLSNARAANQAVEAARAKFRAEALPKAPTEPTLGDAVKTVKKRLKRKVVKAVSNIGANPAETQLSAYIEDMTFSGLPKEVQQDVLRFVDAEKGTPVVHYGMTVKELLGKADPMNLKTARKALGTLRASRAAAEVLGKIKAGGKYVLLMNDRIIDGHHFLAKAERAGITSSLNVLDLTPARLGTKAGGCGCQMANGAALTQFEQEKKKSGWKRKAAIAAGATAGAVLGARTLPRLIRRGRPLKDGEELAGKVLYTHEGLTTPASVVNIGGKTVRRRLEKKALKGSKLAGAALKVDDFLGVPQRHYGVGAGGGRVIEKTKAHGQRMVDKDGFSRGNRIHVDSDTLPKDSSKWGEWAKGMEKRHDAAQGKAKRGDLCLIGNNCEHHARDIAGQGRKSYQTRALVGGAVGGAAVGGAAVGAMTKRKREEKQMSVNAMLLHLFEEARKNRVRDLRDKIGLAKDVAGLGGITAAGIGGVKLYRAGRKAINDVAPQVKASARAWGRTAIRSRKAAANIEEAVALPSAVTRGGKAVGRAVAKGGKAVVEPFIKAAKVVGSWMHDDPRPVQAFARRREPVIVQLPQRDNWQKTRDGALIAGGAATVGGAGYLAHQGGKAIAGLAKRGRAAMRQVPQVTDNIQNATSIGADMGRVYRKARKVVTDSADAFKGGMREAAAKPAPLWAKRTVRIGKKLRLLESQVPSFTFKVPSSKDQEPKNERLDGWRKREYLAAGADKVGQAGGLVAGLKGSMSLLKKAPRDTFTMPKMGGHPLGGVKIDVGPKKGYAIAAGLLPVAAQLAGGKIAEKLARKAHEKMTPKDKQPVMGKTKAALAKAYAEGGTMSYPLHAAGGAGLALAGGGLLKGRRGVNRKVAGAGAAAALLARAMKQKKINRAEDEELNTPKLHNRAAKVVGAIGRNIKDNLLPGIGLGLGAAGLVKARPGLMKWAKKAARKREVMARRRNPAKRDKTVHRGKGPLIDADTGLPVRALPEKRMQSRQALNEFILGALGTVAGTLGGAYAGSQMRSKVYRAIRQKYGPGVWAKRAARVGALATENAGGIVGGAAGSFLTGGLRQRKEEGEFNALALRAIHEFGGNEQLADLENSRFVDPFSKWLKGEKGYRRADVGDYHKLRRRLLGRDLTPEQIAKIQGAMADIKANKAVDVAGGQVLHSALRKADTVRKVSERGGGLVRDAVKAAKGEAREKDRWGREKKREWEKPWFQRRRNQLIAGAGLLAAGYVGRHTKVGARAVRKGEEAIGKARTWANKKLANVFPDEGTEAARAAHNAKVTGKPQSTPADILKQTEAQAKATRKKAAELDKAKKKTAAKGPELNLVPEPKSPAPAKPAVSKTPVSKSPPPPASASSGGGSVWGQSQISNTPAPQKAASKPKQPRKPKPGVAAPKQPTYNGKTGKWEMNRLLLQALTQFEKPFAGYNAKRHARTGGLNDGFRKSYNREHGSNLKRPVTTKPSKLKAGSEAAGRRKSFCARMGGMPGATSKGGELTPKGAALRRWNCMAIQALTQFADPLDVGWDIRDARGNSARVFAPQAGQRDRRPKRWHEKVENERKLWAGAALTSTLAGGAAMRKLMGRQVTNAVKAERAKIRAALQKVRKMRAEKKPTNIQAVNFKPQPPKQPPAAA